MTVKSGRVAPGADKVDKPSTADSKKPKGAGFALFLAFLSLLATAGLAGGAYYFYLTQYQPMVQAFQAANESVRQDMAAQSVSVSDQLQQQMGEVTQLNQGLVADQENLRSTFTGIEEDLSILRYKANWSQREWTLAEVGYLLRMANDRLIYMRDVETTKAALRTAMRRIDHLADPSLVSLQQQISSDLKALNFYTPPDPNALMAKLEGMIAVLKPFPFGKHEAPTNETTEETVSSGETLVSEPESRLVELFKFASNELKSRVRVIHHDEKLNALDQNTVRQHQLEMASLRMEAMRMALVREDEAAFRRELLALDNWATINLTNKNAIPIREELKALSEANIFQPLPTLSGSWQMLQSFLADVSSEKAEAPETKAEPVKSTPTVLEPAEAPATPPNTVDAPVPEAMSAEPPPVPGPMSVPVIPQLPSATTDGVTVSDMPVINGGAVIDPASQVPVEQAVPLPEADMPPSDGKPEVL